MFSRLLPAATLAPLFVVAAAAPAAAISIGTEDGNATAGCQVEWGAASTLNTRLTNNDPEYPDLMMGLDGISLGSYDQGGIIRAVRPGLNDAPGILAIHHSYSGAIESTTNDAGEPVDLATDDTRVQWHIAVATDDPITDADLTFTAPLGMDWTFSTGEDAAVDGSPYSSYDWGAPDLAATLAGSRTWNVPLDDVAPGSGVVLEFEGTVEEGQVLSENAVATTVLTGTYEGGVQDCPVATAPRPTTPASTPPTAEALQTVAPAPPPSPAPERSTRAASPHPSPTPAGVAGTMTGGGTDSPLPVLRAGAVLLAFGSVVLLFSEWRRRRVKRRSGARRVT